jgi:HNH endonuclease
MKNEIANLLSEGCYIIVDHIDGNILNNKKDNLRVRTQSENNMNKKIQSNNSSGIIGVSWSKKNRMWTSYINNNGKRQYLGEYYHLRNALKIRREYEEKVFGEHSFYNRDDNYQSFVNSILNLPEIKEPIFAVKRGVYEVNGVSKFRNKYRARIIYNGRERSSLHETLEDAINWRKSKEVELYGCLLTLSIYKLDRQI